MKKTRLSAVAAVVAGSALLLSACTPPEEQGVVEGTEITIAWNQPFFSNNSATKTGNNVTNSLVEYLTNSGFQYYDNDPKLVKETRFGTIEKVSDDPLQVKYTINEGVKWSDGVQVDAADLMLNWAALSGRVLTEGVVFDYASAGGATSWIEKTPVVSEDGRSITLEYNQPYADWELAFGLGTVAAHGVVQLAYPGQFDDAAAAREKLLDAIVNKDTEWLTPIAQTWNTAYNFESTPSEPQKLLGTGAYLIEAVEPGEAGHVTLKANPLYTWGPSPKFERITIKYQGDSTAALQQVLNGELAIYEGQPSPDLIAQLDANKDKGIAYVGTPQAAYEHIDLMFDNGGPFDPATYGGDAAKALAVRQAFLKIIPRQQILDDFVKPLQANAVLRNSQLLIPGADGYDQSVEKSGAGQYDVQDFEGAKKLLDDAGISYPIDVKFMHAANNPRREGIAQLTQAAGTQSGLFNVTLDARTTWGSDLPNKDYDAVTYAWASTSLSVGSSDQIFANPVDNPVKGSSTDWAGSNFNGYNNTTVNALNKELQATFDTAKQIELMQQIDAELVKDAYGVTLFQHPGITFWNSNIVTGVEGNPLVPYYFWNFWEWTPVQTAAE